MAKPRTAKMVLAKSVNRDIAPKRSIAAGPPPAAFDTLDVVPTPDAVSASATPSLAPRPLIDKYPIVIGVGLSFAYLAACQRIALTGYRQQYVDLLREILERDPHLFAVVRKTVLGVANGRLEITPALLPPNHPDTERAAAIAADVELRVRRIRALRSSIETLAWGSFYGVGAAEIHYAKDARDGTWIVTHLGFIHSRRLSYPDSQSWDLYVWDQGQVSSYQLPGQALTNSNMYGLRVADWPNKFIVFAPQISADYPTREGSGRMIAEWALIKRANARNALVYLEQFAKPIPTATYNTADPDDEKPGPRVATNEDIAAAQQAVSALASGSLGSASLPDSITLELRAPAPGNSKVTFKELNELCNEEESKATVGNTLTTSVGQHGGNRALGDVHKSEEQNVLASLADSMADAVKDQLVTPLTLLNHADSAHLIPQTKIHLEDEDPAALLKLATDAAASNIPVDADEIGAQVGLPLVPKPAGVTSRRMMPLDVTLPTDLEPELAPVPGPNTAGGAKLENEKTKAAQPHVMPGAPGVKSDAADPATSEKDG